MSDPALIAVDDDADALLDIEETLRDRYGRHYRSSAPDRRSRRARSSRSSPAADEDVALVLAGQWLEGMTGSELLDDARRLHPHAKRSLLIAWGDWGIPETGKRSSTRSRRPGPTTT